MKIVFTIIMMLMTVVASAKGIVVSDTLLNALIQVESGGDSTKVGKLGELGILQIRPMVIKDVNRVYKTHYVFADARNNQKAKDICRKYLSYYGQKYEKKTGKKADNRILSKIWNGGPRGPFRKTTYVITQLNRYWMKVKRAMA